MNVQPYSGSPANLAIYLAFLEPGDTVMGLSLPAGGHLTHGWSVSATGIWFNAVHYGVDRETGRVDMDAVRDLALSSRPKILFCGGTAVPRTIDFAGFAEIAGEVGALMVADVSHIAGLIAGGAHPSPIPHADVVMTTTHKTLRGPRGALLMCREEHAKAIDRAVFPGLQGGPHQHQTAAIAATLVEALAPEFSTYAHGIVANSKALAEALIDRGFDLVSGGTDNHLILLDVTTKGLSGKQVATALARAGIVTNANSIPFDPRKPFDPSGVRIGTPAVTTRGLQEDHMVQVAEWMNEVVASADDDTVEDRVRAEVHELMGRFPAPGCRHAQRRNRLAPPVPPGTRDGAQSTALLGQVAPSLQAGEDHFQILWRKALFSSRRELGRCCERCARSRGVRLRPRSKRLRRRGRSRARLRRGSACPGPA